MTWDALDAAYIEQLEADNRRKTRALELIATVPHGQSSTMRRLALEALEGKEEKKEAQAVTFSQGLPLGGRR